MKIDTKNGWFKGLGDICVFAWLGEGMIAAGEDVEFFATDWRAQILKILQMPTTNDPSGAILTHEGYETAVKNKSPMGYMEFIAHHFGIKHPAKRPRIELNPMAREMGRRDSADVIIFPFSLSPVRTWPKNYFVELGLLLQAEGYTVKYVMEQRDYGFFMPFKCIIGESWDYMVAAIQSTRLMIGNDSGPAHLAGTIGTPTIVICGSATERVYSYNPIVTQYRKKAMPCAGCHCLPEKGFRATCEVGCMELSRTFPEEIAQLAIQTLKSQEQKAA